MYFVPLITFLDCYFYFIDIFCKEIYSRGNENILIAILKEFPLFITYISIKKRKAFKLTADQLHPINIKTTDQNKKISINFGNPLMKTGKF